MLTDSDRFLLETVQLATLRQRFPILEPVTIMITNDACVLLHCEDAETADKLINDSALAYFIYLATGCDELSIYLNGTRVSYKTQLRLSLTVLEVDDMAATTLERTKVETPARSIAEISQELATAIAAEAMNQVQSQQATTPMIETTPPAVTEAAPARRRGKAAQPTKPAAKAEAPKADASRSRIRLKTPFEPAKSNWMQSAKRYLRAAAGRDTGEQDQLLAAILEKSELGQTHFAKALSAYPKRDQDEAKLFQGFVKVSEERSNKAQATAE